MGRAPCCEKVGLKRGRWTAEEDEILANYVRANGEGSWRSLPRNAGLLRCGKSCRLRWINYLRSDLKRGKFSPEEDEIIFNLHATLGNRKKVVVTPLLVGYSHIATSANYAMSTLVLFKRWSVMARQLAGRTDNEIKNYWNSHLSRKFHRSFSRTPLHHFINNLPNSIHNNNNNNNNNNKKKKNNKAVQRVSGETISSSSSSKTDNTQHTTNDDVSMSSSELHSSNNNIVINDNNNNIIINDNNNNNNNVIDDEYYFGFDNVDDNILRILADDLDPIRRTYFDDDDSSNGNVFYNNIVDDNEARMMMIDEYNYCDEWLLFY